MQLQLVLMIAQVELPRVKTIVLELKEHFSQLVNEKAQTFWYTQELNSIRMVHTTLAMVFNIISINSQTQNGNLHMTCG